MITNKEQHIQSQFHSSEQYLTTSKAKSFLCFNLKPTLSIDNQSNNNQNDKNNNISQSTCCKMQEDSYPTTFIHNISQTVPNLVIQTIVSENPKKLNNSFLEQGSTPNMNISPSIIIQNNNGFENEQTSRENQNNFNRTLSLPQSLTSQEQQSENLLRDSNSNVIDDNIQSICKQIKFNRNCLLSTFGFIIEIRSNINSQELFQSHDKSNINLSFNQKERLEFIRNTTIVRSRFFLVMNLLWFCFVSLSYFESQDWLTFKQFTLDSLSIHLLQAASGVYFSQLILCSLLVILSIHSIIHLSIKALKVYFYGVITIIAMEFLTNVILMSFVPIALPKCIALITFHSLYLISAKLVINAMNQFMIKVLPVLYHIYLSNLNDKEENAKKQEEEQQIDFLEVDENNQNQKEFVEVFKLHQQKEEAKKQNLQTLPYEKEKQNKEQI